MEFRSNVQMSENGTYSSVYDRMVHKTSYAESQSFDLGHHLLKPYGLLLRFYLFIITHGQGFPISANKLPKSQVVVLLAWCCRDSRGNVCQLTPPSSKMLFFHVGLLVLSCWSWDVRLPPSCSNSLFEILALNWTTDFSIIENSRTSVFPQRSAYPRPSALTSTKSPLESRL